MTTDKQISLFRILYAGQFDGFIIMIFAGNLDESL
jgi:hypothetical protein